jgi:hypothetical protein
MTACPFKEKIMSKKDEKREGKRKEGICPICQYDCHDKESLKTHMDWAHKQGKATTTTI